MESEIENLKSKIVFDKNIIDKNQKSKSFVI